MVVGEDVAVLPEDHTGSHRHPAAVQIHRHRDHGAAYLPVNLLSRKRMAAVLRQFQTGVCIRFHSGNGNGGILILLILIVVVIIILAPVIRHLQFPYQPPHPRRQQSDHRRYGQKDQQPLPHPSLFPPRSGRWLYGYRLHGPRQRPGIGLHDLRGEISAVFLDDFSPHLQGPALAHSTSLLHPQRKREGGHAILAGDIDFFLVLLQNGLDDIQAQAIAVLILAAGLVAFVEPLEQQR